MHRKNWRSLPDQGVGVGPPTLEMKGHSEELMDENDVQVPDEDDRVAARPPPHGQSEQQDRERADLDVQFSVSPVRLNFVF